MKENDVTANQVNGTPKPLAMPVFGEVWPVTPPQPDPQAEADRADAAALLAKANEMHEKAGKDADRVRDTAKAELDRARAEAQRIRDEAAAETDQKKKTAAQLDVWAARVVIAGAVGLTASGEYSLARMVGFGGGVAWLLPLVIDVYVIQAFRRHRDILQAIGLTIAANVIYHLAAVGLFGLTAGGKPQWWLIAVVASIASLILWRMHLMIAPPREQKARRRERVATTAEAPVHAPTVVEVERPIVSAEPERPALTEAVVERAQIERPVSAQPERVERAQDGRPPKPATERRERAQGKPKKSAVKSVADRRRERVRALYADLGKRPEWTEIRDALVAGKLADKTISRSSCQRIRDAIEADHPELAALGSPNVRSITGS
jgi:hypothetical protein